MVYQVSEKIRAAFEQMMSLEEVKKALDFIEKDQEQSIQDQIELVQIEAPTFHEEERAKNMKARFEALGLEDVHIDRGGSVVGLRKGSGNGPKVLIEGHLDTVFPFGTVKGVKTDDEGYLYAPGIGDDTRALAMLLSILRALNAAEIKTSGDIVFVCTTREEGMGSLGGMKDFLADNNDIDVSIDIDNNDMTSLCYRATGGYTMEFNFYGIGGHAFGAFGTIANPASAAARAVAKIADFEVPAEPKTSFCVSNIHTGSDASIHAFPDKATFKINFRSNSPEELEKLKERVFAAVQEACDEETRRWNKDTITWDSKIVSQIPAGVQDDHAPLVEAAACGLQSMGIEPTLAKSGCTNANIAIAKGIPAICLGRAFTDTEKSRKIHNHSVNEHYSTRFAYKAVALAFETLMLAAGIEGKSAPILPKK